VLRGSGSVMGSVFADWNGNGIPDAGEEALANIPVHLGSATRDTRVAMGMLCVSALRAVLLEDRTPANVVA